MPEAYQKNGRPSAKYEDTWFLSQEGEWFLAGVLDGLPDGASNSSIHDLALIRYGLFIVMPMVSFDF